MTTMTFNQAHQQARLMSAIRRADAYVVREGSEYDATDDAGLDTCFAGAPVVATYFDGEQTD